jgi:hypothetical protein
MIGLWSFDPSTKKVVIAKLIRGLLRIVPRNPSVCH